MKPTPPAAFIYPDNPAALATCRELGRAGIRCTVFSERPGPAARSKYAEFVPTPSLYKAPRAFAENIVLLAKSQAEPPLLFPTEDAALLMTDAEHQRLSAVAVIPYSAPRVVPGLLDKRGLYETAERAGLPTPAWHSFETGDDEALLDELDDPARWLVKPACRYWFTEDGSIATFLSMSGGAKALEGSIKESALRIAEAGFPVIVQEKIDGPFEALASVGLHVVEGEVRGCFFARKRCEYPRPFGDGLIVETVSDPGVLEDARALLDAAGYSGICDIEFKRDPTDGKFKVLDANPRVWLWHGLAARSGYPLARSLFEQATGAELAVPREPAEKNPRWVSPRGALAYLGLAYKPGRDGLSLAADLAGGAAATVASDFRRFRDPVHARPASWKDFIDAARRRITGS